MLLARPCPLPLEGDYSSSLLLKQSVTLFKPAGYFNFYWNPCMRYLFFASVWLHDYFILCQNRIFGINDPKTCPRLNTAEVTFVAYHCKDLKGVIWVGLLVVPKKISCLGPLFCIVIRNKEHNSKYFGMLTDFRTPTPQFLTSKYPPALLYHCSNTGFPPLPMWDKSLPSSWLTPEAGGRGGRGCH